MHQDTKIRFKLAYDRLRATNALRLLDETLRPRTGSRDRYHALEHLILDACTDAYDYHMRLQSVGSDRFTLSRQDKIEFAKRLREHLHDVNRILAFWRLHESHVRLLLRFAKRSSKVCIKFDNQQPYDVLTEVLKAYAPIAKKSAQSKERSLFVSDSRIGPIDFGERLSPQTQFDGSVMGLAFQLGIYFRRFTSDLDADLLGFMGSAEPMPSFGRPCWNLCSEIIAANFAIPPLAPDDLRSRMRDLLSRRRKMTFVGWPDA